MRPLTALLLTFGLWLLMLWCHWRILTKAGLNRWLIVLFIIPYTLPIGWIALAVMDWPSRPAGARVKVYGRR
jgi:hypothetical protein